MTDNIFATDRASGFYLFWCFNIISLVIAYGLRYVAFLNFTANEERSVAYFKVVKISLILFLLFLFIDHVLLRYALQLYFMGTFTDWVIYLLIFFCFDILFISIRFDKQYNIGAKYISKLSAIYKFARKAYIILILARILIGEILLGRSVQGTGWVYPQKDIIRIPETSVFNNLILEVVHPGGLWSSPVLEIYLRKFVILKQKIGTVKGDFTSINYEKGFKVRLAKGDTVGYDLPITYIIKDRLHNRYILAGCNSYLGWDLSADVFSIKRDSLNINNDTAFIRYDQ